MTSRASKVWRPVKHPLRIAARWGWTFGRASFISPRGTVYLFRRVPTIGCFARRRSDFELNDP